MIDSITKIILEKELSSYEIICYRITDSKDFNTDNKWYNKLDKNIPQSWIYFIPDDKKQIENWLALIKKEKKKDDLYLHKVKVLCKKYKYENFTWKNVNYIEVIIDSNDIINFKVLSTIKK